MNERPLPGVLPPGWEFAPGDPSAVICSRCLTGFDSYAYSIEQMWAALAERIAAHDAWHLENDETGE